MNNYPRYSFTSPSSDMQVPGYPSISPYLTDGMTSEHDFWFPKREIVRVVHVSKLWVKWTTTCMGSLEKGNLGSQVAAQLLQSKSIGQKTPLPGEINK